MRTCGLRTFARAFLTSSAFIMWSLLNVAAGGVGGFLQHSTRRADGAFATLTGAEPKDRGRPGIGFHSALRVASRGHPRQYLENAMAIPLGYGPHPRAAAL